MRLLYGTGNQAKLDAMRKCLAGLDLEILGLTDMERQAPEAPEDGNTPLENARQKALFYYRFYGLPVFSCDSGLYIDKIPEELQPGVHVRNVGGKHLTDEEMQDYYGGLARTYGDLTARYRNAVCLVLDENHIVESMDESIASSPFLLTSRPHSRIRKKGFPLDSISIHIGTGKYYYDLEDQELEESKVDEGFREFFGKLEMIQAALRPVHNEGYNCQT